MLATKKNPSATQRKLYIKMNSYKASLWEFVRMISTFGKEAQKVALDFKGRLITAEWKP